MSKTLCVGNLALSMTAGRLAEICEEFGRVSRVRLAQSPLSGQSRGFGFVVMDTESGAATCLGGLNDQERDGRKLKVANATAEQVKRYVGRK